MPRFAWTNLDGDNSLGVVVHGVGVARVFRDLLHIVADGLGVVEFGDLVADGVGVLTGGEAVDNESIALGEDTVVKGTRLLGSHDEGEARSATLADPFDKGIGAGFGVTGRGEQVGFVEEEPDEGEINLGVFAFDLFDFFSTAVEAPLVVHFLNKDAGEHSANVPRQSTGTAEIEDDEFAAFDDFLDF